MTDDRQRNVVNEFFTAVERGELETVGAMLDRTPELAQARDENRFGAPPLNIAATHQNQAMIALLLERGADPNAKSDWAPGPFTPLVSVPHQVIELIDGIGDATHGGAVSSQLIDGGAVVDVHAAAHLGMVARLAELLDSDPSLLEAPGGDGQRPLHFAASVPVARLLLDRGAEIESRDVDHESTPAQWAVGNRPEVARYLVERGAAIDPFMAIVLDDRTALKSLLDGEPEGINIRLTPERFPYGPNGDQAGHIYMFTFGQNTGLLHAVAHRGTGVMAQWLLADGADPTMRGGYDDATPLHSAAWHDNVDAMTAFLDAGADIDVRSGSTHNNTPLGWAIVGGSARVAELLVQRGAAILDFFANDAEAGVRGEFRCYSSSPAESWVKIRDLLAQPR